MEPEALGSHCFTLNMGRFGVFCFMETADGELRPSAVPAVKHGQMGEASPPPSCRGRATKWRLRALWGLLLRCGGLHLRADTVPLFLVMFVHFHLRLPG